MDKDKYCSVCEGRVEGYICILCGKESSSLHETHLCGNEYCAPRCAKCHKDELSCLCHGR